MSAEVFDFASHEDAAVDMMRISILRQSLGDRRCREVVEEVVFQLTDRMSQLDEALTSGDCRKGEAIASRLASLSEQVGLADFARVARDLQHCLRVNDAVALAAVTARLMRLSEDSLYSVLLYTDQSAL